MISKGFHYLAEVFAFQFVLCSSACPQSFNRGIINGLSKSAGVTSTSRNELRIRVVDRTSLGVRVLVALDFAGSPTYSEYSDWSGNVTFQGLVAGKYTVLITLNGKEVYRKGLRLPKGQNIRSELVRLPAFTYTCKTDKTSVNDLRAPEKAHTFYLKGLEAIRSANLEKALEDLDAALKVYPAYSKSHNARGVVLHMSQRNKEAEDEFRAALRLDAGSFEPRFNLGKLLLESNRPTEARVELRRAFELNDESISTFELLVDSMLVTHDTNSAISLIESVHRRGLKYPARIDSQIASELQNQEMVLQNNTPQPEEMNRR